MKQENVDYKLVGAATAEDQWDVEILSGDFAHTVIRYGSIELPENSDTISFNFEVVHCLDESVTVSNEILQEEVGEILQSVLQLAVERFIEETEIVEEE
jgi:hypothetical protein